MIKEVELRISSKLKDEPIIYDIIKKFDIIPNIIEASFSTEMGWALIKFQGQKQELDKLFDYLSNRDGIEVKIR